MTAQKLVRVGSMFEPAQLVEYQEIYDMMPKNPETGLLVVDHFVDFVKALAVTCDEKNAQLQLPARARRQFAGKDELTLEDFSECIRGTLWTRIQQKLEMVRNVFEIFDTSRDGKLDWSEVEEGFISLLDGPSAPFGAPRMSAEHLHEAWRYTLTSD